MKNETCPVSVAGTGVYGKCSKVNELQAGQLVQMSIQIWTKDTLIVNKTVPNRKQDFNYCQ